MLYPFMTLPDGTEIVHSESYTLNGNEHVLVEIEKPVYGGFNSAQCVLPEYRWSDVTGFTSEDMEYYQSLIESVSHIIIQLAREGGFKNASGF